ncbi:MAG: hypothetical protein ABJC19_09020 [Gemmatimonadota bacterium]
MMSFYQYDQVGRDTRWFAHPLVNGKIRLGYLIGYYYDVGNVCDSRNNCENGLTIPVVGFLDWIFGGGISSCRGHLGDSEWITLDLRYDGSSHHWVLSEATLSAHNSPSSHNEGVGGYPTDLEYPVKDGWYPRIYVSDGKHANYQSDDACDAGGTLSADDCWNNSRYTERLNVMASGGNIGNWTHQLVNGVTSVNPNHPAIVYGPGYTRTEYYFTSQSFCGWYPGAGLCATGYAEILSSILPVATGSGLP